VCLPIGTGNSQTTPAPAGPNNTLPAADGPVMGGCVAAPSTPAPASFLSLILLAGVALLRTRREQR
jgi:MYXO-CTERM domain-containing protein